MDHKQAFGWLVLLLLAGFGLPAVASAAPAAEQRCTELGANCICSEPMNWQQAGGGSYGGVVDPADSEGAGAKECGKNGQTAQWDSSAPWRSVAVPDKPATAAASWQLVQEVTHSPNDGDNINWWWGGAASTSNGTMCTRHYSHIGTLSPVRNSDHRLKVLQWLGNTANLTQMEWAWDQSGQANQYLRPQSPGTHGSVVSFQDCRGAWCRIEHCLDFNGSRVSWRVRISKVGVPAKTEIIGPVQQANTQPAPLTFPAGDNGVAIGDIFAQCLGTGNCPTGTRHIAFGIQTLVQPMNTSFWPGAAYEVEGGSGSSAPPPESPPPDPPATTPPPTTSTLGKPGTPTYQP